MACAADGAVRVWRNYGTRGAQRLATAWQSVLVAGAGSPARPAAYHWSPGYSALFAAGGRSAGGQGRGGALWWCLVLGGGQGATPVGRRSASCGMAAGGGQSSRMHGRVGG
jgi:hypothetical protein